MRILLNIAKKINQIIRCFLGVVLIFSSLTKALQHSSTVLIIDEYFIYWHLDLDIKTIAVLIWLLICIEFALGAILLLKKIYRVGLWLTFSLFLFFTFLTLVNLLDKFAYIHSCGCFGDFIKFSPEFSFYKNCCLLLLTVILLVDYYNVSRKLDSLTKLR